MVVAAAGANAGGMQRGARAPRIAYIAAAAMMITAIQKYPRLPSTARMRIIWSRALLAAAARRYSCTVGSYMHVRV